MNITETYNNLSRDLLIILLVFAIPVFAFSQNDTIPPVDPNKNIPRINEDISVVESDTLFNVAQSDKINKTPLLKRMFSKNYPDPGKAALFSLVLPGSGQIYNKKYWKLPFVYGAIGGLTYVAVNTELTYRRYRDNYKCELNPTIEDCMGFIPEPRYANLTTDALKTRRNTFDKWRQQAYVGVVIVWVLGAVDAFVDAHLATFDVDEDLSLIIDPALLNVGTGDLYSGMSVKLEFKSNEVILKEVY